MSAQSPRPVQLPNRHLDTLPDEYLFHLDVPVDKPEVVSLFKDVKFVCVGGTASRMEKLARHLATEIGYKSKDGKVFDYSFENDRYSGYLVGQVFCVNHGIGNPSMSIMLHEVFKLLQKAQCCDVTLIRLGTCGGIGLPAGAVVVSTGSLTVGMEPVYITSSLGKTLKLPTTTDPDIVKDIVKCKGDDGFEVVAGKTYCADDFYQAQGRLDGSFCDYTKEEQAAFLKNLFDHGVRNIEMESAGVLGLANKVGIKAAVVCVVIVDRLVSELPTVTEEQFLSIQEHPIKVVSRYIKQKLGK